MFIARELIPKDLAPYRSMQRGNRGRLIEFSLRLLREPQGVKTQFSYKHLAP